jgi:ABC-type glycerol-3-phosphate transport system permease component
LPCHRTADFAAGDDSGNLLEPDEQDFRLLAAAALVNIMPVLVVFTILQRFLISGLASGAVKQ